MSFFRSNIYLILLFFGLFLFIREILGFEIAVIAAFATIIGDMTHEQYKDIE